MARIKGPDPDQNCWSCKRWLGLPAGTNCTAQIAHEPSIATLMSMLKLQKPEGVYPSYHSELAHGGEAWTNIGSAVRDLLATLDHEIIGPLVLPEEKEKTIKNAFEAATDAANRTDHLIELLRSVLTAVVEDLYGKEY